MSLPNRARLLALAQLVRIPNVFTAFADIALAACAGMALTPGPVTTVFCVRAVLLALASGALYLAGMAWNDYFDAAEDVRTRPSRPIPSGRIPRRQAAGIGAGLLILGLVLAGLSGLPGVENWDPTSLVHAGILTIAILLYDGWLKHFWIGPLSMASCRFLNVLMGLSIVGEDLLPTPLRLQIAGVVGVYIVGVTWFARTEEGLSAPRQLLPAAAVIGLSLVLALILRSQTPNGPGSFLFPYLLVGFGFYVGQPIALAIRRPQPREVQRAVKRCVLGLVALDAILATAFVGVPGLLVLFLLPPGLVIGKWVYST